MSSKGELDQSVLGRGLLAAGATVLTLGAGQAFMRPAVYPLLVWKGLLPFAAAAVAAALGAALAYVVKRRRRDRHPVFATPSTTWGKALQSALILAPGVAIGAAVILLLQAGYLGYAD